MKYNLNTDIGQSKLKKSSLAAFRKLFYLIGGERRNLIIASIAILINSALSLLGPFLIGYTIDTYIQTKQYHGILVLSLIHI